MYIKVWFKGVKILLFRDERKPLLQIRASTENKNRMANRVDQGIHSFGLQDFKH